MTFGIERVDSGFPCEEAEEHEYINVEGEDDFFYTIKINTLEELMKLYKKYGKLIISDAYGDPYTNAGCKQKIIICEDWLEYYNVI